MIVPLRETRQPRKLVVVIAETPMPVGASVISHVLWSSQDMAQVRPVALQKVHKGKGRDVTAAEPCRDP